MGMVIQVDFQNREDQVSTKEVERLKVVQSMTQELDWLALEVEHARQLLEPRSAWDRQAVAFDTEAIVQSVKTSVSHLQALVLQFDREQ